MNNKTTSFWMIFLSIVCLLSLTAGCASNRDEGLTGGNTETNHVEDSTSSEPEIKVPLDIQVLPDDKERIALGNPLRITPRPELIEQIRQSEEEKSAVVTGLFETIMDLTQNRGGVSLNLILKNISESTLSINFDVGGEYDIFVTNSAGEEIYRRSHGKELSLPAISHHKLKTGEKLTFSAEWNYKDNNGNRVPAGEYTISVVFNPWFEPRKKLNSDELTDSRLINVQ